MVFCLVLPEDNAAYIQHEHELGHKVVMIVDDCVTLTFSLSFNLDGVLRLKLPA